MTTFLLSPGPFCGQCGHPKATRRAYRCQTCPCTTNHRFATTTRTKHSGHSPLRRVSQRDARSGGGNPQSSQPRRAGLPFLRALRSAGWLDLLPIFAGLLLLMAVALSVRVDPWGFTDLVFTFAGVSLVGWGLHQLHD